MEVEKENPDSIDLLTINNEILPFDTYFDPNNIETNKKYCGEEVALFTEDGVFRKCFNF